MIDATLKNGKEILVQNIIFYNESGEPDHCKRCDDDSWYVIDGCDDKHLSSNIKETLEELTKNMKFHENEGFYYC